MPMDKAVLGALIKTKIAAADPTDRDAVLQAIADAVITHIQTAALVVGTSVSGGPVTGTIT